MLYKAKVAIEVTRQYFKNLSQATFYNPFSSHKKQIVFFDLKSVLAEPYYFNLVFFFSIVGGYETVIKNDFKFIGSFDKYSKPLLKIVKVYHKRPKGSLVITDHRKGTSSIFISPDYYSYVLDNEINQNQFLIPYMMHPSQYQSGEFEKVSEYRENERIIKIFFSGNQDKEAYSNIILKNTFKKLTRHQLIHTLDENLNKKQLIHRIDPDALNQGKINKFLVNKWTWTPRTSSSLESRINNEGWLQMLSKADFFLAASGITMPLCFNLIESMAVGTIPIIQHPEHLYPRLIHMENSIVFHDKDDLIEKINLVLSMPEEDISRLRSNVISYYDNYLAPKAVIDRFMSEAKSVSQIVMNLEYPSYSIYSKNRG